MSAHYPHILVVGGGYVGMYTALRLQRRLRRGEARVTVVDPRSYMTYQPFLPEAAAGSLEPRHVVVPLRRVLHRWDIVDIVTGEVTAIDPTRQTASVTIHDGETIGIDYDHLVMAPGSVSRTLPIPGLADCGVGFKRVEEAIYLRNHVIDQLDIAASARTVEDRHKALTFVFVGGGYAGVEALAELEDMARSACRYYENIEPSDMRWVLVEATGRILPEVGEDMGRYTVRELQSRGIEVRLHTRLESAVDRHVVLSDGTEMDTNTLVWTAGVKPHPVIGRSGLPIDDQGRLKASAWLQVEGMANVWTAGDCAAVPDLTKEPGAVCGPSAQHAVRQAKVLAGNIVAALRGLPPKEYRHAHVGSVASLGLHKGVAQVYGIKLRGWPAWFMHRSYHASQMPTMNRKARVVADWTLALFFPREIVTLGSLQQPQREFAAYAARPEPSTESSSGPAVAVRQ